MEFLVKRETDHLVAALTSGQLSRRTFILRLAAVGVSATGIASVLTACDTSQSSSNKTQGPPSGEAKGDLILYKGPFSPDEEAQVATILSAFSGKFPAVAVKQEQFAWEAMAEQFPTRFLSDSPPDVNAVPDLEYAKWVERGAFEDLTPYVTDPSWETEFAAIPESIWDIARTADGKIYGIPWWGVVLSMLVVNRDLLERAGVTDFNSSLEAFTTAVQQLSELDDDTFGFAMRTDQFNPAAFDWAAWLHTSGTRLFNEDWTSCAANTPEAQETFQVLSDLLTQPNVAPKPGAYDQQGLQDLFIGGRIGITHAENSFVANLQAEAPKFKYDVAAIPPGASGEQVTGMWGVGLLTMSSKSPNKPAAWELIKYLTSADVIVDYFQQVALLPNRSDLADRMYQEDPYTAKVVSDILPGVRGWQLHPDLNEMLSRSQASFDSLYRGQKSSAATLEEVCAVIEGIL